MRKLWAALGVTTLAVVGPAIPMARLLGGLAPAAAEAVTVCAAGINGTDANGLQTPQKAYKVQEHTQVSVDGSDPGVAAGDELHYLIQLQFYYPWGEKVHWTVAEGNTTSQSFVRTVDVDKYATKSTGLYLVNVVAYGPGGSAPCQTSAFVDVTSSSTSDAEVVAGALGVAGLAGTVGAGLLAAREGSALADADLMAEDAAALEGDPTAILDIWGGLMEFGMCAVLAPLAVALTLKAMISHQFHHVLAHITRSIT